MPPLEGALLGVSGRLNSIVKHRILGLGKRMSGAKTGGPILIICMSYDLFLHKDLLFGVAVLALALKFLVALSFF